MKKEITILFDKLIEFSLWLFIFSLPFSNSLVEISFSVALVLWVIKRILIRSSQDSLIEIFKPVSTKLNAPIYLFFFLGFLSTLSSASLHLSLQGLFCKLFEWIMIYFIVVETVNSESKLKAILTVMIASMFLISVDGLWQFTKRFDFIRHYSFYLGRKIGSSLNNPNKFAGWLTITIPLSLGNIYFWKNRLRYLSLKFALAKKLINAFLWILTGLLTICLILTYSKGGWIGAVLALLFFGIFRTKKFLIFIVIILICISFFATSSIKDRLYEMVNFREIKSFDRITLWKEALHIVKDFPLLGSGLNTYTFIVPRYKLTPRTGVYPHNSYLHMAAESGILELGVFILIMALIFKSTLANIKIIDDKGYKILLISLLAGLLGFLAHSFVDVNFYSLQLGNLMWFIMGLIIATQRIALEEER